MSKALIVLLSAILVVLSVVAFELRAISRDLQLVGDVRAAIVAAGGRPPESRAERNARLQRQQRELTDDMRAILDTPDSAPHKPAK